MADSPTVPDLEALSAYDFELPPDRIAQAPRERRDGARLLVLDRASGRLEHRLITDLPGLLGPDDVAVVNDTRVLRARLLGHRLNEAGEKGGKVEFLMLERTGPRSWEGLFHAAAHAKPGFRFFVPGSGGVPGLTGVIRRGSQESVHRTVVVEFDRDPDEAGAGQLPLPPYIDRPPSEEDESRYQTVYAREAGSAAAPTAGLHFTPELIEALRARGVGWERVTLHVGLGTFRPVKAERVAEHEMHEERFHLAEDAAERLTRARVEGKRILAVGTTSMRTLESAWDGSRFRPGEGRTRLFLRPGGTPVRSVDRLLTNFHLPRSTLLMLVCAMGGYENVMRAYRAAVNEGYRFFSYGDAMLLK